MLPRQQLRQDLSLIQLAVRYDLGCLLLISLDRLTSIFKTRIGSFPARAHEGFFKCCLEFLTIYRRCNRIVALLDWLIDQIIGFEEVEGKVITAVYQDSELQIVELIVVDGLDAGGFERVVLHVDPDRAILA